MGRIGSKEIRNLGRREETGVLPFSIRDETIESKSTCECEDKPGQHLSVMR